MRRAAALTRETVVLPPFVLFFKPDDALRYFNYARPCAPPSGDLSESLAALRAAFRLRERLPRFEFIAEYAPDLPATLRAVGFIEESRQVLMICTPEAWQPASEVSGLEIVALTGDSALADLCAQVSVQRRGFGEGEAEAATEADGRRLRRRLQTGTGAFLARIHDGVGGGEPQAVGAAEFTPPLDGLTELVGIATLPPYRRRGIATALTASATRAAFDRGVEAVFLVAEDERAGRVYARVGFRPYATALAYSEPG